MWGGWEVGEGRRVLCGGCFALWRGEGVEACRKGVGYRLTNLNWVEVIGIIVSSLGCIL